MTAWGETVLGWLELAGRRARAGCRLRNRQGHGDAARPAPPRLGGGAGRFGLDGGAGACPARRRPGGVPGGRPAGTVAGVDLRWTRSCRRRRSTGSPTTTRCSRTWRPSCGRADSWRRSAAAPATSPRSRRRWARWTRTSAGGSTSRRRRPRPRRLEAAGFVEVETWLHEEPTPLPEDDLEPYLETICLGDHVEGMSRRTSGGVRARGGVEDARAADRLRAAEHPRPPGLIASVPEHAVTRADPASADPADHRDHLPSEPPQPHERHQGHHDREHVDARPHRRTTSNRPSTRDTRTSSNRVDSANVTARFAITPTTAAVIVSSAAPSRRFPRNPSMYGAPRKIHRKQGANVAHTATHAPSTPATSGSRVARMLIRADEPHELQHHDERARRGLGQPEPHHHLARQQPSVRRDRRHVHVGEHRVRARRT